MATAAERAADQSTDKILNAIDDAVVKALESVEDRKVKQQEASRYEKMELARWAIEQVIAARSGATTDLTAANTTAITQQAETLMKFVTDKRDS